MKEIEGWLEYISVTSVSWEITREFSDSAKMGTKDVNVWFCDAAANCNGTPETDTIILDTAGRLHVDTEMMTERLQREKLAHDCWYTLGGLIQRMHAAGIRHADLTTDNILMDSANRFYLVDFDKARIMPRLDGWQWPPLKRLQRSIIKRHGQQALQDGYRSSPG